MEFDVKQHLRDRVQSAATCYVWDLTDMPETMLSTSPGGVARTPYDFTYEVAQVNRRITMRLRGEEPEPVSEDGFVRAPEAACSKQAAIQSIESSVKDLLEAWDRLATQDLTKKISSPMGDTDPSKLMSLAATHMMYHDGQLNYLQAIEGDEEVHWKF